MKYIKMPKHHPVKISNMVVFFRGNCANMLEPPRTSYTSESKQKIISSENIIYSYLFKRRFTTWQPSFLGAMSPMLVSGRVPHRIHGTIVYLPMVNVGKYTSGDLIMSALFDDQPTHPSPDPLQLQLLQLGRSSCGSIAPPLHHHLSPPPKKYRTSN